MAEVELQSSINRREYEFRNVQIIYDLAKRAMVDSTKISTFKARYKSIEKIRDNFIESHENFNKLQLKLNPEYKFDNKPLLSFDELYYAAVEFADSLGASTTSSATSEPSAGPSRHSSNTQVKLPKLQIPKFDGCSSLEEARQLKSDIVSLLSKGHFELRKWSTNTPSLLSDVPPDHCQTSKSFEESGNEFVKILGIRWNPSDDNFSYSFSDSFNVQFTKRSILSIVARIYDPLGWISPVVFAAKSLLQEMWRSNLSWDEAIPKELAKRWHLIAANLSDLQQISLPRLVVPSNPTEVHLVGFCDGSLKGYGCCVYLCVVTEHSTVSNLLIGKSRVAPIKPTTVNRLELCAAVLLARVLSHMNKLLKEKLAITSVRAYSDSTTTLSWLNTAPHLLKMYIANRVVQATDSVSPESWYHVPTEDNPADCCSRGVSCTELAGHPLRWKGPTWLQKLPCFWPSKQTLLAKEELPELKSIVTESFITVQEENIFLKLTLRCSSFTKLLRTLAWCIRFVSNLQKAKSDRKFSALTSSELDKSMKTLVKFTQNHYMSSQVQQVQKHEQCEKSVQKLSPFLDEDGLMRVGGRIDEAKLSPSALHPLLLPKQCPISRLIVDYFHLKYLHCGPRSTMPVREGPKRPLVGVIDDGTKTVRFVIYEAGRSDELVAYQMDKTEVQPHEGWSEQDPLEIIHHIKL
ncbi:hypothetical protein HF086_001449 [Spodoptera exigua]|uniref:Uncharacterized protein n=1 Tax=Spodoptera exigua TaxID=7107 RepID=A0A922SG41_SPOEX|nr:hypothetical protein HF086_001449 [Spodoptera exigua]